MNALSDSDLAPSWREIRLDLLRENLRRIRAALSPGAEPLIVVKADAYGHGARAAVRCARAAGVRRFSVAHYKEALEIRDEAPAAEILVAGAIPPAFAAEAAARGLTVAVVDLEHARAVSAAAARGGRRLAVHIKVDTGMGRLGFDPEACAAAADALFGLPGIEIAGVFTHFARVAGGAGDPAERQMARFLPLAERLSAKARRPLSRHVCNTAGLLRHPEWDMEGVRPGISVYGYCARDIAGRFQTRPILSWKTRVAQVRRVPAGFAVGYDSTYVTPAPTTLAVLAVGYADGYPRALSGKGVVLIGGRRCPVVGRVSMDWIAADAGPEARVSAGDEAALIGRQGEAEIWADELAERCGTIPYEILTGIRGERRYFDADPAGAPDECRA